MTAKVLNIFKPKLYQCFPSKRSSNSATTVTEGDEYLDLTATTIDVLDVILRRTEGSTTTDLSMEQLSRAGYWNIPNKSSKARPTQWFLDKQITPRLYFWPAAENSTDKLVINRLIRIEDADASVNTLDMPFRFYPCLAAGLAYYLAIKKAPDRIQILKAIYDEEFDRAATEDRDRTSLKLLPYERYI